MPKPLLFNLHALAVMAERELDLDWITRCVETPEWTEPNAVDPQVVRCFGKVPERDGRYLRVACVESETEIRIISAFLDRRARQK